MAAAAPSERLPPTAAALASAVEGRPIVLFGEVHDNAAAHALRAEAMQRLVANGARPAFAFEQFDRERQADIERARRDRPKDADYVIGVGAAGNDWNWELYRPLVQLALDYDLPIVAANLSRRDATRVAREGWDAVFDAVTRSTLGLDALPAPFLQVHERAIASGHCNLLPDSALPPLARAQIARDIVLTQSLRPYVERGVVLFAGLGHVRRDVGVPFWLTAAERAKTINVGLLERDEDGATPSPVGEFDAYTVLPRATRPDPCKDLDKRMPAAKR